MTSKGSKLVAILLVAVVVAGGAGYWLLTPKIPNETTSIVQQTSLLTPMERSRTSTEWTVLGSPTTGPWATTQTLWINVTATKPVSYYISLLKSAGAQPYVDLGWELQALPDATNATTVAKITYLALNATNPEVKEAFQLMIKGGTPNPRDFKYSVPAWNTQLEVLYWLALQNNLKKDDTLALAIAMVNGFWVTIGNDEVKQALRQDANDLLNFFRETNQMQSANGYYELENYPLEAKVCLAWTASITPNFSALPLVWGIGYQDVPRTYGYFANGTRATLEGYHWNAVSIATLRTMRTLMTKNGWMHKEPSATIPFMEQYFYFTDRHLPGHWEKEPACILVDGRMVHDYTIGNVNWQLDFYLRTGKFQGQCTDESQWMDAWAKSWGIATTTIWRGGLDSEGNVPPDLFYVQHFHPIFYDPSSRTWKASEIQLGVGTEAGGKALFFMIFRPPVDLHEYFSSKARTSFYPVWDWLYGSNPNMFFWYPNKMTLGEIKTMLTNGLETAALKRQVLYGQT